MPAPVRREVRLGRTARLCKRRPAVQRAVRSASQVRELLTAGPKAGSTTLGMLFVTRGYAATIDGLLRLYDRRTPGTGLVGGLPYGNTRRTRRFYCEHYATVDRAVGGVLRGADRETVVHEVFFRILSNEEMRRAFTGGSAAAWVAMVARNHAIDYRRRRGREVLDDAAETPDAQAPAADEASDAKLLVDRFRREVLPEKWRPVFEACFLQQLSQREAAQALGMSPDHVAVSAASRAAATPAFLARGRAMRGCDVRRLVDRHFAGSIAPRDEHTLREHLPSCVSCFARYERQLVLAKLDPRRLPASPGAARARARSADQTFGGSSVSASGQAGTARARRGSGGLCSRVPRSAERGVERVSRSGTGRGARRLRCGATGLWAESPSLSATPLRVATSSRLRTTIHRAKSMCSYSAWTSTDTCTGTTRPGSMRRARHGLCRSTPVATSCRKPWRMISTGHGSLCTPFLPTAVGVREAEQAIARGEAMFTRDAAWKRELRVMP